jgi:long-chain acyl-CoA synthetase
MDASRLSVWGDAGRRNAAAFPDRPAFIAAGRLVTFSQFNERANRLNNALGGLGLRKGDRVAILSRNRPEFVEAYGVAKSGLIAVPLNWRLSRGELLHPLKDSRPAAILAEPEFAPLIDALRGELDGLRHAIGFGVREPGWRDYEELLAGASDDEPQAEVRPDDVLCLMYTSGTTGQPKGAMHTHRSVLRNCEAAARGLLQLSPGDVTLAVMPLFHVGGMWYHLFPSFASGCTTVMLNAFEPGAVLDALERHRVTNVHLVPTMVHALVETLRHEQREAPRTLAHLRRIYYAASSIPMEVLRAALSAFSSSGFVQSYGSTEAGIVTALTPEDHARAIDDPACAGLLSSCGRALGGVDMSVLDEDGRPAPAGAIGEIAVRGERTMAGYWPTRRDSDDDWLRTDDMGRIDEDGYLTIIDRKHDMIVSGGENVYPCEVEEILYRDPDVLEAAVFGMPDARWVEKVAAAVVLRPGSKATAEDIIGRARLQLAGYKCPKTVILAGNLPRTATGKVLKKELRRLYIGPRE